MGINQAVPDLSDALTYAYVMVGLRAANFPSEKEETMLINFILRNYGGHTVDEIMLAFEMAVAGKLHLESSDIKVFENFTPEYFSKVMNAFRKWASQAYSNIEKLLPAPPTELSPWYELQLMEALYYHMMRDRYLRPPLKKFTSRINPYQHENTKSSTGSAQVGTERKDTEADQPATRGTGADPGVIQDNEPQ